MAKLAVAGLSLGLMLAPAAAMAQYDSRVGAPPIAGMPSGPGPMQTSRPPAVMHGPGDRWGQVPGGWGAYRRPSYGYTLPRYWVAPSFYIANWNAFGLPAPAAGFGWSHYYDDMVLTDRWGRVYDWRSGQRQGDAYDGREDYADSYGYHEERRNGGRRNDGVAGTVAGAVVGGVAGNLIGGRGNRLAGTLIGGGVGSLVGGAIERSATSDQRARAGQYDRGYSERYEGYGQPHWLGGYEQGGTTSYGYEYGYGGGYSGGGTTVTTVVVESAPSVPVVTRSVSYQTEYVSVPVRHRVVRHYRPRPRPSCVCGS